MFSFSNIANALKKVLFPLPIGPQQHITHIGNYLSKLFSNSYIVECYGTN